MNNYRAIYDLMCADNRLMTGPFFRLQIKEISLQKRRDKFQKKSLEFYQKTITTTKFSDLMVITSGQ